MKIDQLQKGIVYNFQPPQGQYPSCFGVCTLMEKSGVLVQLRQEMDSGNPNQWEYNEKGEAKPMAREIGRIRLVMVQSFESIEPAMIIEPAIKTK